MEHQIPRKFEIGQRIMVIRIENPSEEKLLYAQGTITGPEQNYPVSGGRKEKFGYEIDIPSVPIPEHAKLFGATGFYCMAGHCLIPIDDPDQGQTTDEPVELVREG